jgi:GNAT superfamily N-acetyltransferase
MVKPTAAAAVKAEKKARLAAETERERERRGKIKAALYGASGKGVRELLAEQPAPFARFDRNGLALDVVFTATEHASWTEELATFVFDLTKANMQSLYEAAPDWGWKDSKKRGELFDEESRFLIARDRTTGAPVAAAVFRFLMEDDVDVLYVYELQLTAAVQRKGLGKHLMLLMEMMARRCGMQW